MKIGIDARFYGQHAGIGRYVTNLIVTVAAIDRKNVYTLFVLPKTVLPALPDNFSVIEVNARWYGWQEQIVFPYILLTHDFDVIHFPHWNVPLAMLMLYPKKIIVTIHDLILRHYHSAAITTRSKLLFVIKYGVYRITLWCALRRASAIATVSRYTQHDVERLYSFTIGKTTTIHVGISQLIPSPTTSATAMYAPYLLYVGSAYPHKNLTWLVQTFTAWHRDHPEYSLVLIGHHDAFYDALADLIPEHIRHKIHMMFDVSDDELFRFYQSAVLFIFPSLYEGFGLPPLEAMSCGTPVIASDSSCMPEILKDGALFFKSNDKAACMRRMDELLENRQLQEHLRTRGRAIASEYSWIATAEHTIRLYETV
jgi:glycosyltransferase involved in cell wall biosynthesis